MSNHKRKCWDCGNVAMHSDNIVPEVLCKKCGSQDTRLVREPAAVSNSESPSEVPEHGREIYHAVMRVDADSTRKELDQLRARASELEQVIRDAMSDPETILSYKTIKSFQSCLSDWPMKTGEGDGTTQLR